MRRLTSVLLSSAMVPAAIALPTVTAPVPSVHPVPPRLTTVALAGVDAAAARQPVGTQPATAGLPAGSTLRALSAARSTAGFSTVGVTWAADRGLAPLAASVRIHSAGRWSAWTDLGGADDVAPDAGSVDVRGHTVRTGTSPLWAGPSDGVQARVALTGPGRAPRDLRVDLIDPGTSAADKSFGTPAAPPSAAAAAPGLPTVIRRAQWGADESIRKGAPSYSATVKIGFVHHTDTSNVYTAAQSASIVRSIYAYHVLSNGWSDIGYNFLVDRYGQIFEGRYGGLDRPVIGAHTGGFNTDSFAGSLIGNFTASTPPAAMISSLERLFAWKLSLTYRDPYRNDYLTSAGGGTDKWPVGQNVAFHVIAGHRDAGNTTCPGDVVYNMLPRIRADVRALMTPGIVNPTITSAHGVVRMTAGFITTQSWTLTITSLATGVVVRRYAGGPTTGIDVSWPRTDAAGVLVRSGQYRIDLASGAGGVSARPWSPAVGVVGWDPGAGAASAAAGTLDVFAAAPGVALAHYAWNNGSGWSVRPAIPDGSLRGGPAVVVAGSDLQVFVRGTDDALYQKVQGSGGGFGGWVSWGGRLTSQPAAVADGDATSVFVRGTDWALYRQVADATGRRSPWIRLGGVLSPGTVAGVTRTAPGSFTVLVHGVDGALWQRRLAPGFDSGWASLGGALIGDPAAVSASPGRIDLFVRGTDDALWHRSSVSPGAWSGWTSMGGVLASSPAVAASATGKLDVIVRGSDGMLYQKSSATGWLGWTRIP